jgi:hypothetical protein
MDRGGWEAECRFFALRTTINKCYSIIFLTFRTNIEIQPELSENKSELIYRFRGFRGDYKVQAIDPLGKVLGLLNEDLKVETDTMANFEVITGDRYIHNL